MLIFIVIYLGLARINPHLGRKLYSEKYNYNWDKDKNSSLRILSEDGKEEVGEDMLIPDGVDGVVKAYNDKSIGIYIKFNESEGMQYDLWAPLVKGNYLCGGGDRKQQYSFAAKPAYVTDNVVDGVGVIAVLGVALVIVAVVTSTWPLLLQMNKTLFFIVDSWLLELEAKLSEGNVSLEYRRKAEEMMKKAENIRHGCLTKFSFIWMALASICVIVLAIMVAQVLMVQLGLRNFYKLKKLNKCYYVDQSNLTKKSELAEIKKKRKLAGTTTKLVKGEYIGTGKFKCKRGHCIETNDDKNVNAVLLTESNKATLLGNIVAPDGETIVEIEPNDEDMLNATETPKIEKDKEREGMKFTTPCGTAWRQLSTGATWVMTSPYDNKCDDSKAAWIDDVTYRTQYKCWGGNWNGEWGEPPRKNPDSSVEMAGKMDQTKICGGCCGFLSMGSSYMRGQAWFEYVRQDGWKYCNIEKKEGVYLARQADESEEAPPPKYRILEWKDVREERKYGWYDNGDYMYAIPENFENGKGYSMSFNEATTVEMMREKVMNNSMIVGDQWRKKGDFEEFKPNVDDYTCSVTFLLENPSDFVEFQEPCDNVEAIFYKDNRIMLKTNSKYTCRVKVRFSTDDAVTEYSINANMATMIPPAATDWNCLTAMEEGSNATYSYTAVSCSDNKPFMRFTPKDYTGSYQTNINCTVGKEPTALTGLDLAEGAINLATSLAKELLGGGGALSNMFKSIGVVIAIVFVVGGVIVVIVVFIAKKFLCKKANQLGINFVNPNASNDKDEKSESESSKDKNSEIEYREEV